MADTAETKSVEAKTTKAATKKAEVEHEEKDIPLEKKPLSQLLGEMIEATIRTRASFPNCRSTLALWYEKAKVTQPDSKEFAKLVMQCCDTMRLAAEGLYSEAMSITAADR